jgi:peptidoglycan/LPS O-acetylase OafA/YrhL
MELGVSLTAGCIAAVLVVSTSRLNVASSAGRAGAFLGDASYGIYLLHPLVFIASKKLLSDYTPLHWRLAPVVVTLAVTPVVAFMVNRHIERPLGLRIKRIRYGRANVV